MKYIIRSSQSGLRIPETRFREKEEEVIKSIIETGKEYILYEALLGSVDFEGNRIREHVSVIETVEKEGYQDV